MTLPSKTVRRSTLLGWLLLGLLGAALGQGCSSSAKAPPKGGTGAASGGAGKDNGSMTVEPPGTAGIGGESPYNALCGIVDATTCVPDDAASTLCKDKVVSSAGGRSSGPTSSGGAGGKGGSQSGAPSGAQSGTQSTSQMGGEAGASQGGAPGTSGEGPAGGGGAPSGQGGEPPAISGQSGQGGAGGEAGVSGVAAAGGKPGVAGQPSGTGGQSIVTMRQAQSCQVAENSAHKGQPLAQCLPAGVGTDGSACFSGADCAPGLACIGSGPGICRAYCCDDNARCEAHAGTHCTVERLVSDKAGALGLNVPVCMPAVKCSLAEPFPCGDAPNCSCPDESACAVVSDDGTTSCVPVSELAPDGMGLTGDPCPCAWGYVCSATHECVKLCELAAPEQCMSLRCQASARLPDGWGTCIGDAPKDAGAP